VRVWSSREESGGRRAAYSALGADVLELLRHILDEDDLREKLIEVFDFKVERVWPPSYGEQ
jgi:hypothetical protein